MESFWTDLLNEDGVPQLRLDPDTRPDARSLHGAAQTQLESVLGRDLVRRENLTLDMLLKARNSITAHLGRTVKVREYNVKSFRKQIGRFVDSQNKRQDVSTWPLVKVCRISHNWPLLASGAVLVDLPGVRDANAARGRIAEGYLKCCNAIWVVADITRAVDNRTAKDLLGDTFRRQMVSFLDNIKFELFFKADFFCLFLLFRILVFFIHFKNVFIRKHLAKPFTSSSLLPFVGHGWSIWRHFFRVHQGR